MANSVLQQGLKNLLVACITIATVLAGTFLLSRLLPISKAQQQALAALQPTPQDHPGRNAYTALATLNLEGLSSEQRQARVDAFIPRYAQWQTRNLASQTGSRTDATILGDAPTLTTTDDRQLTFDARLCSFDEATTCLDKLRKEPKSTAEALAAQQDLLTRIGDLSTYAHYRLPPAIVPGIDAAMPSVGLLATPLAAHAQDYLQGNANTAMAGLCRDASSARMLMAHSDNLLLSMIGGKMLEANAQLLANILAELPTDMPLPSNCIAALSAPTGMELSTCTAMRGEFMNSSALFHITAQQPQKEGVKLLFDEEKTGARVAETMAFPCLPQHIQQIGEDRLLSRSTPYPSLWKLECVANYLGCALSNIASPSYNGYIARQQDNGASIRLLQSVLWLRAHAEEQAGQSLAERLQTLPLVLRQGPRSLRASADGSALELPAYSKQAKGKHLSMPVPKTLLLSPKTQV